jgi:hypothetical protein
MKAALVHTGVHQSSIHGCRGPGTVHQRPSGHLRHVSAAWSALSRTGNLGRCKSLVILKCWGCEGGVGPDPVPRQRVVAVVVVVVVVGGAVVFWRVTVARPGYGLPHWALQPFRFTRAAEHVPVVASQHVHRYISDLAVAACAHREHRAHLLHHR